jgi:hypothetical protein
MTPWLIHPHLFFLAWLPRLELRQRVRRNSTCRTPSRCRISSSNPSSSVALLDRSPDDVYTSYVCNPSEVPHLWHCRCTGAFTLALWLQGFVALWCCGIEIFTTLRSATSSSSSMPVRGHNPRDRSTRVLHRSPLIVTALLHS